MLARQSQGGIRRTRRGLGPEKNSELRPSSRRRRKEIRHGILKGKDRSPAGPGKYVYGDSLEETQA